MQPFSPFIHKSNVSYKKQIDQAIDYYEIGGITWLNYWLSMTNRR